MKIMMKIYATTFGEMLRALRLHANLTQSGLGQATGYSPALISRLESNARCPDIDMVYQRFVPALQLEADSADAQRLIALAHQHRLAQVMGSSPPLSSRAELSTAIMLMLVLKVIESERMLQ